MSGDVNNAPKRFLKTAVEDDRPALEAAEKLRKLDPAFTDEICGTSENNKEVVLS